MSNRSRLLLAVVALFVVLEPRLPAQTVNTAVIGPQVGATVPAFSGVDQFGRPQDLASLSGPRGLMLVFNRSADW